MADLNLLINLLAKTDGRDKIYKAAVNLAKYVAFTAAQSGNKERAANCKALAKSIGDGRSLMRMGKWVNNIKKLSESANSGKVFASADGLVEYVRISSDFGYVFGDNVQYLIKNKLVGPTLPGLGLDHKGVVRQSKLFQFWGYFFAVVLDIMKISKAIKAKKAVKDLYIALVKDVADFLVLLDTVGYAAGLGYKPNGGFTSMCGFTSGAIATYQNVQKLLPAPSAAK
eukprot:PhM_4_TR18277/c0_g1_i1/m.20161